MTSCRKLCRPNKPTGFILLASFTTPDGTNLPRSIRVRQLMPNKHAELLTMHDRTGAIFR